MTTINTASTIRQSGTDTVTSRPDKPTIAIVGTGWAGWTLAQSLSSSTYNIVVISPSRTMALTPLLASAACAIYDFRMAEEPVRRKHKIFEKYQAVVTAVDFEKQKIQCRAAIGGEEGHIFDVEYDKLILCPGSETNTFGTEGVHEYTMSMKDVKDAMRLRERMLDCFELASLPIFTDEQRKTILHFAIVGGGPTGVEIAAEMDDTVHDHLFAIYPHCRGLVSISVYDVAERILGVFGAKLSEYTMERFSRRGVNICMSRHVEKITKNTLYLKEDGEVGFGLCVWAVGNKASSLVDDLDVKKTEKGMRRILTDRRLRVLKPSKSEPVDGKSENDQGYYENVFALGDAADIDGLSLPTTAEVALQKAKWLSRSLKGEEEETEFKYKNKAFVAYIGNEDGVIDKNDQQWTGARAWLAWRSGSLEWSRSWRRKTMIWVYWLLNSIDGREIARK